MIHYEWRSQLDEHDAAQLRDLLVRAAAYDAEPEYNAIDPDEVVRDMAAAARSDGAGVRHLVIWLDPRPVTLGGDDEPERVAGVIRLVPRSDGWADGTIVIDPDLRSIGIVTLLLEREGVDVHAEGGWLGSEFVGIRSWARGNHPASGRIGDRNLLPRTQRVWKLVRPRAETAAGDDARARELSAADADAVAELLGRTGASDRERERCAAGLTGGDRRVLGVHGDGALVGLIDLDLTPTHVDEFGRCAGTDYLAVAPECSGDRRREALSDLLIAAAARATAAGLDGLIAYAPSTDDGLVAVSRRTGFQHDRTDVLYEIR
ncbi:hypothetical protein [Gordonia hydrophobica]|uniref:N-acetyltransferase n=1 Tax=Gordonia hydrophobica TaxID=40516 RepID=A0ABZ2U317_9ACTN|nr:hypothetical protein [Gordonia hydrophobica]MBM7367400.1 mycothiol synthase [Gordonia hydrophobica]